MNALTAIALGALILAGVEIARLRRRLRDSGNELHDAMADNDRLQLNVDRLTKDQDRLIDFAIADLEARIQETEQ